MVENHSLGEVSFGQGRRTHKERAAICPLVRRTLFLASGFQPLGWYYGALFTCFCLHPPTLLAPPLLVSGSTVEMTGWTKYLRATRCTSAAVTALMYLA